MLFEDCGCGCANNECSDDCSVDGQEEQAIITMVDSETGEEYQFAVVDDFEFKGQTFCVLVTVDEEEPELVITNLVDQLG